MQAFTETQITKIRKDTFTNLLCNVGWTAKVCSIPDVHSCAVHSAWRVFKDSLCRDRYGTFTSGPEGFAACLDATGAGCARKLDCRTVKYSMSEWAYILRPGLDIKGIIIDPELSFYDSLNLPFTKSLPDIPPSELAEALRRFDGDIPELKKIAEEEDTRAKRALIAHKIRMSTLCAMLGKECGKGIMGAACEDKSEVRILLGEGRMTRCIRFYVFDDDLSDDRIKAEVERIDHELRSGRLPALFMMDWYVENMILV